MSEKPLFIKRNIDTKIQEYLKLPEILAIIGPRQAGKTTYLQHLLKDKGGSFISFEDVDVLNLFNNNIKEFVKIYIENIDLLCIDEFQYSKHGGKNLKYIYDTYPNKKVIISGSSAIDITINALKFLVGRVIVVNFWPFDKNELKRVFKDWGDLEIYDYYSKFGGYPRVALAKDDEERKLILKNIYNTYFLREVKDLLGLVDEYQIQKLLIYLAEGIGGNINYSKIANSCDLAERDVRKYLEFMNKTFVSYIAKPFFTNKLREIVKQPKVYYFDSGFLNHVLSYGVNDGKKMEQVVVMELIKKGFEIKYWRDKKGHEMDFVIYKDNKIIKAIESKNSATYTESFSVWKRLYPQINSSVIDKQNIFTELDKLDVE